MLEWIGWVPLFPLIGMIILGLGGARINKRVVGVVGCGSVFLSFLISVGIFVNLLGLPAEERLFEKVVYTWISSGDFRAELGFQVDPLSSIMLLVVSGVGFLIHVYSIGYMQDDKSYTRYFTYLNLFTFMMLLLVSANNFLLMFVGWEGVGLCSYLLIGFWYERKSAADAGKKAFVVNRVGDFGFALGMMLIFVTFGSLDYTEVFQAAPEKLAVGAPLAVAITLLLFLGATGKSAQVPLYVWLPDAMEGPTPVSALIHAATMVTAGVYMVARCSAIYVLAPQVMIIVAVVGALTAFLAATIGLVQNDIKRVLAYSTVSQLGYMFLACGVGAFGAGIFHLFTHAFYKALLFMGAGSVIHGLSGEQDLRRMGALRRSMPVTWLTFLAATLAIAGTPFFSGFFSKDEILWESLAGPFGHPLLWLIGVITAGMTAFYMFRLYFLTFHGESRVEPEHHHHLHESPWVMTVPLAILAVLSVIGGYVGVPKLLGGANRIHHFLEPVLASPHVEAVHHGAAAEWGAMLTSIVAAAVGFVLAYRFYLQAPEMPGRLAERFSAAYQALLNKYYVDEAYEYLIVQPIKRLSYSLLFRVVDARIIDGWMVNGSARLTVWSSHVLGQIQTGYVKSYALAFVVGVVFVIGYYTFR